MAAGSAACQRRRAPRLSAGASWPRFSPTPERRSRPLRHAPFVHLRVRSCYSLLESTVRLEELLQRCRADAMPAVGITDRANLFDALTAGQEAAKAGVQPLVGCLLPLPGADPTGANGKPAAPALLPVLVQSEAGYQNLLRLLSRAYLGGAPGGAPEVQLADLAGAADGLIALTGGPEGPVGKALLHGNRGLGRGSPGAARGAVPGPALRRADAPWARGRGGDRAGSDRPRPGPRSAAGRDQRRPFHRRCRLRGARRPAVHRRRRPGRPGAAPPADARAPPQDRGRDGRAVRRSAGGDRQHPGDRPALQLHGAGPRPDPAQLSDHDRPGRGERAARPGRGGARRAARRRPCRRKPISTLSAAPYRETTAVRVERHHQHEVRGLLPDRRRLHPLGEGAGHPRRPGARLGRGLGGRLVARDHRPRPAPLRPAVRALPQPRAGVDAGLRRRLLPGPARRGDPLRARQIRRGPGRGDHHLRQAAGARRAPRRRPGAGHALRPGRPGREAGAVQPGPSADPRAGARARAQARRGGARGRAGRSPDRDRPEARGPAAPRLDPRRGRRDRRPAAGRAGAALPRSALRHAGDAIQHEGRREGGPGQVRLSRPDHADAPGAGRAAGQRARHEARARRPAARRSGDLRAPRPRRGRRACSSWNPAACAMRCASSSPTASTTSSP